MARRRRKHYYWEGLMRKCPNCKQEKIFEEDDSLPILGKEDKELRKYKLIRLKCPDCGYTVNVPISFKL